MLIFKAEIECARSAPTTTQYFKITITVKIHSENHWYFIQKI